MCKRKTSKSNRLINKMHKSKSKFLELSKKYNFLKKIYYFYNIYIRYRKFLKNSSQLGEDKYLLNCFPKKYIGKYLDLGCYHPTKHNNTYLMYKQGWSGINIDLNPLSIELFNYHRPRDINLNNGISNKETYKKLYFIDELNTQNTLDKNQLLFLKNHHNIKKDEIINKKIKTKKIMTILNKYKYYNIDFMNIDIEGHELDVLKTIDFKRIHIKYLCIEMINHNKISKDNSKKIKLLLKKNNFNFIKNIKYNFIYKKN